MPADFGRARGNRIELHPLLTRGAADAVVRHELAHVFLEARCPGLAASTPLLSEAFALFFSGDAARRTFQGTRFVYASAARDWLAANASEARSDSRSAQQALARVLSEPRSARLWETTFARLLSSCDAPRFSGSGALAEFLDAVRGLGAEAAPSRTDFLLVDGLSGDTLAQDGRPRARSPAGSILKPSLVASAGALLEPRPARDSLEWRCPGPPAAGDVFTWERALATSCNGFFLDAEPAAGRQLDGWDEEMKLLGVRFEGPAVTAMTMDQRIGLRDGFTLSPLDAVRLFAWLDRKAPFVVDALRATAREGTLAAAPGAEWFVRRGIALKTGTVRDAGSAPLHAWIVAVGPRDGAGPPAFLAALHATGRSTASLLPELERRLAASLTGLERPAEVQVLGLVPDAGLVLSCGDGAPLLRRSPSGSWSLREPATVVAAETLRSGEVYACPAAALEARYADGRGSPKRRRLFGALRVEPLSAEEGFSSVPLREKSARARRGSRFVLATSERAYAVSSVLSELPAGHTQLLAALALVVRNNRHVPRHGERPPCDTTHCSLFGQDGDVPAAARRRAEQAVALTASLEIAAPAAGRTWLPFFLGGARPWTQVRSADAVARALGLGGGPVRLSRAADGAFEIAAPAVRRFPCEVVRNQLRLPSCPESATLGAGEVAFRGRGEGHGQGLDLTRAAAAASEGAGYRDLLALAWPELDVEAAAAPAIARQP